MLIIQVVNALYFKCYDEYKNKSLRCICYLPKVYALIFSVINGDNDQFECAQYNGISKN